MVCYNLFGLAREQVGRSLLRISRCEGEESPNTKGQRAR